MNTGELNAIRAKIYGGCTIRRIDVKDLLAEIDRLTKDNAELTAKVDRLTETNKALESDNYNAELNLSLMTERAERAEREKGCEFCCYQEYHDKTLYPKEGYVFYAGFSKQIDVDDFDEIETDEINYCPMCGKRLEAQREQN